jgi:Helix-turn-helix domain
VTYSTKELIANRVSVDALGWRAKRRKAGLRLRWVANMLGVGHSTICRVELGKQSCPQELEAALNLLYAQWAKVAEKQRALEAQFAAIRAGTPLLHKGFTHETARSAGKKGNETRKRKAAAG